MSFSEADLTQDGFLGGRLTVAQPRSGYRAGIDPVLLAAAVPAAAGEAVLELGLGTGVAVLCLAARVPGLVLTGLERQPAYAALARRNAAANGVALEVVEGDIRAMPETLKARSFDRVLANPPYFRSSTRSAAADAGREAALGEDDALADWVTVGMRRLRPGGTLTLIQAAERLPDLLAALPPVGLAVRPLAAREGRPAERIIVTATKGARTAFRLLPALILHQALLHRGDGDDFADWARACLRQGAALPE